MVKNKATSIHGRVRELEVMWPPITSECWGMMRSMGWGVLLRSSRCTSRRVIAFGLYQSSSILRGITKRRMQRRGWLGKDLRWRWAGHPEGYRLSQSVVIGANQRSAAKHDALVERQNKCYISYCRVCPN